MLELLAANYRHPVRRGTFFRPWATGKGPGIRDVNLKISPGKVIGLVGPNGAGKTTLMQVLSGLTKLDDGELRLEGRNISLDYSRVELSMAIGYMPESVSWEGHSTPLAVITRLCSMRGISSCKGEDVLKIVGLSKRSDDALSTLSQGMKQRLSLATSLLGNPKILILDEPLNGLDPVAQAAFRILLSQLADQGVGVVVSSHSLLQLERIVDEVILMHHGRILVNGPLSNIEQELGLSARLEIAGIGKEPTDVGEHVTIEEIPTMDGEDWAYRLHLESGEWDTMKRFTLQEKYSLTRLTPLSAELEEVLSSATGVRLEDAGFDIFSEVGAGEDE